MTVYSSVHLPAAFLGKYGLGPYLIILGKGAILGLGSHPGFSIAIILGDLRVLGTFGPRIN
jgi:hypothetical protein